MTNCPQCGNQFDEKTGRRPKKFCSDECKVKWWNEQRSVKVDAKKPETTQIKDLNGKTTGTTDLTKEPPKSNYAINTIPTRNPGEDAFDFAARKNEWKRKNS